MSKPIVKGSVVKYKDGHYRVTALFEVAGKCNLGTIFGRVLPNLKRVDLRDCVEDEEISTSAKLEVYRMTLNSLHPEFFRTPIRGQDDSLGK